MCADKIEIENISKLRARRGQTKRMPDDTSGAANSASVEIAHAKSRHARREVRARILERSVVLTISDAFCFRIAEVADLERAIQRLRAKRERERREYER